MPNAPAKRAAYLMVAIGVVLLAGSFVTTMYALLRPEWITAQLAPHKDVTGDNPLLQQPRLTWLIAVFGALGLIESGLSIALGLWILRGHRWAVVTSLVLTGLRLLIVGLMAGLMILAVLLARAMSADAADLQRYDPTPAPPALPTVSALNIGISVGSAIVLMLLMVWLIQALRADRRPASPLAPVPGGEG